MRLRCYLEEDEEEEEDPGGMALFTNFSKALAPTQLKYMIQLYSRMISMVLGIY